MSEVVGGRYTLKQKLATGGMAEVWLAEQSGVQGFTKSVVIKRILPGLADQPDFVRMFLDEARLLATLRHPNVVAVTDVGEDAGHYFMAMEYLPGKDLGEVFRRCREKGERLPLEVAARLVADVARGLHHAHTRLDAAGAPLRIVHRDVSPQNILLTWDGVAHLIDFGVAWAARRDARTDAGVVKGKLGYMPPEQLEGSAVDARADQFALGIVLYELTTLSRLFARPSDAEVMRAVLECHVARPSTLVPEYPGELEDALMRALAARPEGRYPTCEAFAVALETFLERRATPTGAPRIAQALAQLFPEGEQQPGAAPEGQPSERETRAMGPKPRRGEAPKPQAAASPAEALRPVLPEAALFLSAVEQFLGNRPAQQKSNVVPPVGPLIGREAELTALKGHFAAGAQLVTLVAFGGMGKTRLSLALLEQEAPRYAAKGGTWFVDLASATTPAEVCKLLGRALQLSGYFDEVEGEDSATQAGKSLASLGECLIVLDNFEQLVPHARATVGRFTALAPKARFLVTTREALGLPGEVVQALEPLPLTGRSGSSEDSPAVQLFLARAAAAGAVPPTAPSELALIDEVVRKLDGHALAIELAAARLTAMPLRKLHEGLQKRFAVLGGASHAGRQATLWNTIDWSWQLLAPHEQAAFAQLSVFRGGFTLEAAEGVLELSAFAGAPPVREVVGALHRKSLLRHFVLPEAPRALRLGMFESLAEFASEQLERSGRLEATRLRHAEHFLSLGDLWAEEVHGTHAVERMQSLESERDNLLEVFERALAELPRTAESAGRALRALNALDALLLRKGPFNSHLALLMGGLEVARAAKVAPGELARACQQVGNVQRSRGKLSEAVAALEEALALALTAQDGPLEGRIRCDLAVARFVSGDLSGAKAGLEAALDVVRGEQDESFEVRALASLAIVHLALGELPEALARCDEALPIARSHGDRVSEARILGTLGGLYLEEGRADLAHAFFSEAVERCREVGELRLRGYFLGKLGWATWLRGPPTPATFQLAREQLGDALAVLGEVSDLRHEGLFLAYLASLEALQGLHAQARVTFGSAEVRLANVKDNLLLTALALRKLHAEVLARERSQTEANALLEEVRSARDHRPARVAQSEEVRLAARLLQTVAGAT